ncbi:hypothetical protein WMY93_013054 [Mugilogobius chulae]|uniref:SH3 domain-containing protein n=1 Tax=Mugilogobius chulae TaxID=88201 RepID=A0AAW0NZ88_9GOBI
MFNFFESDVEQVSQLSALIEAALEYHRQSSQILEELSTKLQKRITAANSRPRKEFKSKSVKSSIEPVGSNHQNGLSYSSSIKSTDIQIHTVNGKTDHITSAPETWPDSPVANGNHHQTEVLDQPCCRSLYDFEPENEGELGFKEGDIIILTNQIDDNWYEGMIHGESGFFPINYVQVLVPLPQ